MNTQTADLYSKETKLRSKLQKLELEKSSVKEREILKRDIEIVVTEIAIALATSKIRVGQEVYTDARGDEVGVVYGFQTLRDRTVGVWVVWENSSIPIPEHPLSLIVK